MFTLKHINMVGVEELIECEHVRFEPGKPKWESDDGRIGESGTSPTLWIVRRGAPHADPLTGGTVFVMNEAGKTVSRYDLGASPVPIVGDGLSDPRKQGADYRAQALCDTTVAPPPNP
jgi:hypothetical protein